MYIVIVKLFNSSVSVNYLSRQIICGSKLSEAANHSRQRIFESANNCNISKNLNDLTCLESNIRLFDLRLFKNSKHMQCFKT